MRPIQPMNDLLTVAEEERDTSAVSVIAIDYDHTWSADPVLWGMFANTAIQRGHTVVIATYRAESHQLPPVPVPVHYTAGKAKKAFLAARGINVNIFVDDNPYAFGFDENYKPATLEDACNAIADKRQKMVEEFGPDFANETGDS